MNNESPWEDSDQWNTVNLEDQDGDDNKENNEGNGDGSSFCGNNARSTKQPTGQYVEIMQAAGELAQLANHFM